MTSAFVWHELKTTDLAAAKKFYAGVCGWKMEDMDMGTGPYTVLTIGERGIGGMCAFGKEDKAPPHWLSYVSVDDVDAASERAARSGGRLLAPGVSIPGVGRFSVLADPRGALICTWKGERPSAADGPFAPGAFCWNELVTTDPAAAKRFYGEVFGWGTQDSEVPGMGTYTLWKDGGEDRGGMMKKPPQAQGPDAWIPYVLAENVDGWAGRVTKGGGRLWVPPTDIPNIGRFSVCADPQGATFALYRAQAV
ncbi:MAG: VOC family protein [Planctomycetes bacterium]|nr:VOC family protein [Planctomycetota bacterium]